MPLQRNHITTPNTVSLLCLCLAFISGCAGYTAPQQQDYVERDSRGIPYPQLIGDNPCNEQGYESQACQRYMRYLSYEKDNEGECYVRTIENKEGLLVKETVCKE